jgi:misacylated tRNA(Ala) deacylase
VRLALNRDRRLAVTRYHAVLPKACGGTHARRTAEVGRFSIVRAEDEGKINKRLYVRLDA